MIKHQMFIAVALLAGVAIGYFVKDEPIPAEEPKVEEAVKKPVADKGNEATIKALRHRIDELEKLLSERDVHEETAVSNAVAAGGHPAPGNPQAWIENIRKNDPARYTQMTNRWAQWRQRRMEQTQSKLEFLSAIDVSRMGGKAQETHNALMDLIVQREELMDQLHQDGVTESERQRLWQQMRSTDRELNRLNGQERSNLIREAARNAGVKGKMAQELTATIRDVIEATDSGWGGHHRHGGGPRGPGGQSGR